MRPAVSLLLVTSTLCIVSMVTTLQKDDFDGKNLGELGRKRSLQSIGDWALKYLLKEAKFLYSNGLNNVYTKPGGYRRAFDDFTELNEAKRIAKLPAPGGFYILKVGKVGNRKLYLKEGSGDGFSTLTIVEQPSVGRHATVDPILEKVIVYLD